MVLSRVPRCCQRALQGFFLSVNTELHTAFYMAAYRRACLLSHLILLRHNGKTFRTGPPGAMSEAVAFSPGHLQASAASEGAPGKPRARPQERCLQARRGRHLATHRRGPPSAVLASVSTCLKGESAEALKVKLKPEDPGAKTVIEKTHGVHASCWRAELLNQGQGQKRSVSQCLCDSPLSRG